MKAITIAVIVLSACVSIAQDDQSLKVSASQEVVQKLLSEPDGVAITLKEDGTFQVFARGTGVYDFDDASDVSEARKTGELKAKASLAHFLKEEVSSVQAFDSVSKKTKVMSADGTVQTKSATKEQVTTLMTSITNSANAILSGAVCLKDVKVPGKGSSGQVQVTIGISSKTLDAARQLSGALKGESMKKRPRPYTPGPNNPETRISNTDF